MTVVVVPQLQGRGGKDEAVSLHDEAQDKLLSLDIERQHLEETTSGLRSLMQTVQNTWAEHAGRVDTGRRGPGVDQATSTDPVVDDDDDDDDDDDSSRRQHGSSDHQISMLRHELDEAEARAREATSAAVSPFLACIGSPCLRHCVHGDPISVSVLPIACTSCNWLMQRGPCGHHAAGGRVSGCVHGSGSTSCGRGRSGQPTPRTLCPRSLCRCCSRSGT
jgi:hypothetical protein